MKENNTLWRTKLAARSHDPAAKALALLRDRAGRAGDAVTDLKAILPVDEADAQAVERTDRWISTADRSLLVRGTQDGFDTTPTEEDRK